MGRLDYPSGFKLAKYSAIAAMSAIALGIGSYLLVYNPDKKILSGFEQQINNAKQEFIEPEYKFALEEFKQNMTRKLIDFKEDSELILFQRERVENLLENVRNIGNTNTILTAKLVR